MADLQHLTTQLSQSLSHPTPSTPQLLSKAKLALLQQNALIPTASTPPALLQTTQHILELGALISIRLQDPAAFTRYFQQLQPFYSAADAVAAQNHGGKGGGQHDAGKNERSKITGLYLLLQLSQGDYAGFHTLLESLEVNGGNAGGKALEEDEFIRYPMQLEQWLMEGSYDRVWTETKSERVPSEEFAIFSDVSRRSSTTSIPPSISPQTSDWTFFTFTQDEKHFSADTKHLDSRIHNPHRNRHLRRKSVPLDPRIQREISLFPRLGGLRCQLCECAWLGGEGWKGVLPGRGWWGRRGRGGVGWWSGDGDEWGY